LHHDLDGRNVVILCILSCPLPSTQRTRPRRCSLLAKSSRRTVGSSDITVKTGQTSSCCWSMSDAEMRLFESNKSSAGMLSQSGNDTRWSNRDGHRDLSERPRFMRDRSWRSHYHGPWDRTQSHAGCKPFDLESSYVDAEYCDAVGHGLRRCSQPLSLVGVLGRFP
jgi:hypothetical protein